MLYRSLGCSSWAVGEAKLGMSTTRHSQIRHSLRTTPCISSFSQPRSSCLPHQELRSRNRDQVSRSCWRYTTARRRQTWRWPAASTSRRTLRTSSRSHSRSCNSQTCSSLATPLPMQEPAHDPPPRRMVQRMPVPMGRDQRPSRVEAQSGISPRMAVQRSPHVGVHRRAVGCRETRLRRLH